MEKKRIWKKKALIEKSMEAQLSAIQIYNNPNVNFKTETFIVLAVISWTYLYHAYFKSQKKDYRYRDGKRFKKTKHGLYRYWELEKCINKGGKIIDEACKKNLLFMIGLRHEIEHQMTMKIDNFVGAKLQASALNYNEYLVKWFGFKYSIANKLSLTIQLRNISLDQLQREADTENIPKNVASFIEGFEKDLDESVYNSPKYGYRLFLSLKTANRKGKADRTIEFVKQGEPFEGKETGVVIVKEMEKKKYKPGEVVKKISEIHHSFRMHEHTKLWKSTDAKNRDKNFGVHVSKDWYWYESWIEFILEHLTPPQ